MRLLLKYLATLIFLNILFFLYLITFKHVTYPLQAGPQLDKKLRSTYLEKINTDHPDLVLIGDSMLAKGVDPENLAQNLNHKILDIALPGSGSTLWYLILENNIVEAESPPPYLVLFFRDSELTVPGLRVQGKYLEQIDEFATVDDHLLIQYAYINQMSPLELFAERYLPPFNYRWKIRANIDRYIRYSLPNMLLGCSADCTDQAMQVVFGDDNLEPKILSNAIDAADDYLYTRKALDFKNQIDISFLPEIIRLCEEHHIQLIAVHMKTLHVSNDPSVVQAVDLYNTNLAEYFHGHDVIYLDYSKDTQLPDKLFLDSLHLNDEGRRVFTTMLGNALEKYIQ